jgi:hypothetical protein
MKNFVQVYAWHLKTMEGVNSLKWDVLNSTIYCTLDIYDELKPIIESVNGKKLDEFLKIRKPVILNKA